MSIELAAIACCTRGPPEKLDTSTSMPCRLKMPVSIPTCSGTNWKVPACGWPTRTLVSAWAADARASANAADRAAAVRQFDILSSRSPARCVVRVM